LPFPVAQASAERAPKFLGDRVISDVMETLGIVIGCPLLRNSFFSNGYGGNAKALAIDYVVGRFSRLTISFQHVAVRPLRPAAEHDAAWPNRHVEPRSVGADVEKEAAGTYSFAFSPR
jgi:uncharacterized protein YbjT (DUF2867 family)